MSLRSLYLTHTHNHTHTRKHTNTRTHTHTHTYTREREGEGEEILGRARELPNELGSNDRLVRGKEEKDEL